MTVCTPPTSIINLLDSPKKLGMPYNEIINLVLYDFGLCHFCVTGETRLSFLPRYCIFVFDQVQMTVPVHQHLSLFEKCRKIDPVGFLVARLGK